MSVELLDNPRFFGFRVRRQIEGKTYQEYFSLKENSKRMRGAKRAEVKAVADARDAVLKDLQQRARDKNDREIQLDPSGQIRGILCRMKKEKSGTLTPVFQVGAGKPIVGRPGRPGGQPGFIKLVGIPIFILGIICGFFNYCRFFVLNLLNSLLF